MGNGRNVSLTVSLIKTPDGQVSRRIRASCATLPIANAWSNSWPNWRAGTPADRPRAARQPGPTDVGPRHAGHQPADNTGGNNRRRNLNACHRLVQGIEDAKTHVRALSRGLLPVGSRCRGTHERATRADRGTPSKCSAWPASSTASGRSAWTTTRRPRTCTKSRRSRSTTRRSMPTRNRSSSACTRTIGITLQVRDDGIGMPADPSTAERQRLADHAISRRLDRGHTLRQRQEGRRHASLLARYLGENVMTRAETKTGRVRQHLPAVGRREFSSSMTMS